MTTSMMTVFFLSMLFAWFGKTVPSQRLNVWDRNKPNLICFFLVAAVMVLFVGLRNNMGDTVYYLHLWDLREEAGNPVPTYDTESFLFEYLQYTIMRLGGDSATYIMAAALITLVPVLLVFRKYAPDFTLAVFFYFTTGVYIITMNGIRQFVAAGIVFMATKYLFSPKKSDFIKFLIFVIFAYFFHTSAIILIPIYFVCRRKAWSPTTFMIIFAAFAALIFISLFLPTFLDALEGGSYEQYSDDWFTSGREKGASALRVIFHSFPMILSAIYYKQLRQHGPVVDVLVNLSVVHFAIFLVSLYNWIFARFAFYTYAYMAMLLSLIFSTVLREKNQRLAKIILYAAYMFYFFNETAGISSYGSDFFTPNNTVWF